MGADLDEEARDRVDLYLRANMHRIPVVPGKYSDDEEEVWTLNLDMSWTDPRGTTRSCVYTPMLAMLDPFSPVDSDLLDAENSDHG
jgi:hypothetical protein